MFSEFPQEIILEITSYLPTISLIQFLSSSKKLWNLRERAYYLKNRTLQNYLTMYRNCVSLKDWNDGLTISIRQNCIECVEFFINKFAGELIDWNRALEEAAESGSMKLIQMFIAKGANNWNFGMRHAAKGGHRDIVEFFIELGASDWNDGMIGAAYGGHQELVENFVEKGASDWNTAVRCAAIGGYINLIEYFIQKGVVTLDYALGLSYNKETAKFLVRNGAKQIPFAIWQATRNNQKEVIEYLLESKPELYILNEALCVAAECKFLDLVNYFIQQGANDWNGALISSASCSSDNTELVHFFIQKGATAWNRALCVTIQNWHHRHLIDLFIEKGANNWQEAIDTLNDDEWQLPKEYVAELRKLFLQQQAKKQRTQY